MRIAGVYQENLGRSLDTGVENIRLDVKEVVVENLMAMRKASL